MMNDTNAPNERDEIEMLLPWYATGKLEDADQRRVDAYLEQHPDMRERLVLAQAEQTENRYLGEAADAGPLADVDNFMAKIAETRPSQETEGGGLLSWISDWFSAPSGPALRWAGAVAAIVIVLQAAALVTLVAPRFAPEYREAGVEQGVQAGTLVLVRFAEDVPVSEVAMALKDLDMSIVDGPQADGFFKLRIGPENMSAADKAARIAELRSRTDLFAFVTPTR